MAIAKLTSEIVEIRGKSGGNVYRHDQYGQHLQAAPRLIKKASEQQRQQRAAFRKARAFCTSNECISYNVYRALNNLDLIWPIPS